MRVLQLAPPWFAVPPTGYGGIEWVVSCLADGLADAGHDVTLLASGGSHTHGRLESVFAEAPSARLGETFVEVVHALHGYDTRDRYELIHDHCGAVGVALGAVADGPPVVHTLHGPWTEDTTRLYRQVSDRVHLVAISYDQARRAPDGVRVGGVVHNGIPVERYPLRRDKDGFLLFIGRANHEKGPEVAAQVAARLGRRLVMAVKINEPPERAYFDEVVAPHLDGVDVEVVGQLDAESKADLLGRASAVLFPIAWPEPFGLVMAEANACGTPVVAFADGAAPEVLADGVSGVLVPPGDIDGFAEAVAHAEALDPVACRDHAAERFSAQRMVDGYQDLYTSLIAE